MTVAPARIEPATFVCCYRSGVQASYVKCTKCSKPQHIPVNVLLKLDSIPQQLYGPLVQWRIIVDVAVHAHSGSNVRNKKEE